MVMIFGSIMLAGGAVLLLFVSVWLFKLYLRISRSKAALVFLLSIGAGIAAGVYRAQEYYRGNHDAQGVMIISSGVLAFIAVPFLVNLYLRWIGGELKETEKAPGMEGVRAWLSGGNLICALIISLSASLGFHYSFWGMLALTLMALLAYPVLNMAATSFKPAEPAQSTDNLSPERERVLKMLDDGKITAEESAELLNALGHTVQPLRTSQSTAANPHRKMVLIGLVLLLIGFFLPWFSYNPNDEMARVLNGVQEQMNRMTEQNSNLHINLPSMASVRVSGGDIRYGLGWWVLLLGIAAAALPYVANNLDAETQQKGKLIGLSLGGIILIYLLTQNMRYVSVGIILGMAGYALQLVGTLKERQAIVR